MDLIESALIRATNQVDAREYLVQRSVRGLVASAQVNVMQIVASGGPAVKTLVARRMQMLLDQQVEDVRDALEELFASHQELIAAEINQVLPAMNLVVVPSRRPQVDVLKIQGMSFAGWLEKAVQSFLFAFWGPGGNPNYELFNELALSHDRTFLSFNSELMRLNQSQLFNAFDRHDNVFSVKGRPLDPVKDVSGFIYKHLNNGSGICPKCAPYLNMRTTGDMSDGVPIPPQHPHCKCYLMPARFAGVAGTDKLKQWQQHFEWMRRLPHSRLRSIVGPARAGLVSSGQLTVDQLYSTGSYFGGHLLPLALLGFGNWSESAQSIIKDPVKAQAIIQFHQDHYDLLPDYLKGDGPGDSQAAVDMVKVFLSMNPRPVSGWPYLLGVLLAPEPNYPG